MGFIAKTIGDGGVLSGARTLARFGRALAESGATDGVVSNGGILESSSGSESSVSGRF